MTHIYIAEVKPEQSLETEICSSMPSSTLPPNWFNVLSIVLNDSKQGAETSVNLTSLKRHGAHIIDCPERIGIFSRDQPLKDAECHVMTATEKNEAEVKKQPMYNFQCDFRISHSNRFPVMVRHSRVSWFGTRANKRSNEFVMMSFCGKNLSQHNTKSCFVVFTQALHQIHPHVLNLTWFDHNGILE